MPKKNPKTFYMRHELFYLSKLLLFMLPFISAVEEAIF